MTDSLLQRYPEFCYPRRVVIRKIMRWLAWIVLRVLARLRVEGRENLPESGPLIVVGNHFSFVDTAAMVGTLPWPAEYLGGAVNPNAPPILLWIPQIYGYLQVFRGTGSRYGLQGAEAVLSQNGIIAIFPEGGSWADVLRPARPGTAHIAARSKARILPIGLHNMTEVLPSLRRLRRAEIVINIGEPFGPVEINGRGRERREQLDDLSNEIMSRIADLIPPERRGHFSDDPAIRAAAQGTEIWPYDSATETDYSHGDNL